MNMETFAAIDVIQFSNEMENFLSDVCSVHVPSVACIELINLCSTLINTTLECQCPCLRNWAIDLASTWIVSRTAPSAGHHLNLHLSLCERVSNIAIAFHGQLISSSIFGHQTIWFGCLLCSTETAAAAGNIH